MGMTFNTDYPTCPVCGHIVLDPKNCPYLHPEVSGTASPRAGYGC